MLCLAERGTEMQHEVLVKEIAGVTQHVLETMLRQRVVVVKDVLHRDAAGSTDGVAALVGVAGEWQGNGCISCSSELACKLASQMVMHPYDSVNDDVLDAIGEIANMVIGNIKTNLEGALGPMGLTIPTVIYGHNFSTRVMGKHAWTEVTFDCDGESLQVQLMLTKNVTESTAGAALQPNSHKVIRT